MAVFSAAVSWSFQYAELLAAVLVGTSAMGVSEMALLFLVHVTNLCYDLFGFLLKKSFHIYFKYQK